MAPILYSDVINRYHPAPTPAGRGAFSFADTRVYGDPGLGSYLIRHTKKSIFVPGGGQYAGSYVEQEYDYLWAPYLYAQDYRAIPAQGGGARLPGSRLYGGGASRIIPHKTLYDYTAAARKQNPNGFVLLRLLRID